MQNIDRLYTNSESIYSGNNSPTNDERIPEPLNRNNIQLDTPLKYKMFK